MAPAQHTTLKEGPYQAALAEIAASQEQQYEQRTVPLIRETINTVRGMDSATNLDRAGGLAMGGAMATLDPQIAAGERSVRLAGDGGRLPMAATALRTAAARGTAVAGFGARTGQKEAQLGGLGTMLGVTRGQSGPALAGLAQVAGSAQQLGEQQAEANFTNSTALGQGIGAAAGLAAGSYWNSKRVA